MATNGHPKPMTIKRILYCQEYVRTGHQGKAARYAGFSEASADFQASDLMRQQEIIDYINELLDIQLAASSVTKDRVIATMAAIAFQDRRKMFNEDGTMKAMHELEYADALSIDGFEVTEMMSITGDKLGQLKKVKMVSRQAALDSLAKIQGYNAAEKKEIVGNVHLQDMPIEFK